MLEAAVVAHQLVQHPLARVAEGRVAEVVAERQALGQVLVQPQGPRDRAPDLRDLQRVGEARAVVVALVVDEDLRLVLEPPEGRAVDDPVAVALVDGSAAGARPRGSAGRGSRRSASRRARGAAILHAPPAPTVHELHRVLLRFGAMNCRRSRSPVASHEPRSGTMKFSSGPLAQLGERLVRNQEVAGSSPPRSNSLNNLAEWNTAAGRWSNSGRG